MVSARLIAASYKPLVLSLLANGEVYGYQIIRRIRHLSDGKIRWTPGRLYPLLHQMEAEGLVEATWRTADSGRDRKYYRLTPKGAQALAAEKREWLDVHQVMLTLWGPEPRLT